MNFQINALRGKSEAFTLLEAMGAMVLMVLAVALSIGGFLNMQKNRMKQLTQDELDGSLLLASQRLQQEIRLSSLADTSFYPADAVKYTAISFPVNDDGTLSKDDNGNIIWDDTIVYHLFAETGADGTQTTNLLRTSITPRDNTLSGSELQAQLSEIVNLGHATTEDGVETSTQVVLKNVAHLEIIPQNFKYDGYSPTSSHDPEASLGSFNLGPGEHTLKFTTIGKDPNSEGYALGMDTIHFSTSEKDREAENATVKGTPQPEIVYDASGWSSGYKQLFFEAEDVGATLEMTFYNDRWEESNFSTDDTGVTSSNITRGAIDSSYDPPEFALKLEGSVTNMVAEEQMSDTVGWYTNDTRFSSAVVRCIIKGGNQTSPSTTDESAEGATAIKYDGAAFRIAFTAGGVLPGSYNLTILKASIAESASHHTATPNTTGNSADITFNGGAAGCSIAGLNTVWSDLIDFPISKDKTYAVTFQISDQAAFPLMWGAVDTAGITNSYMIQGTNGATAADVVSKQWKNKPYSAHSWLAGVNAIFTTYPEEGTYTSAPFDTRMDKPNFESIDWTADTSGGSKVSIKVRSSSKPDMTDAPDWSSVSAIPSPGSLNSIMYLRYVQYHIEMESGQSGQYTPKLRNLAIQWPGESRTVSLGGTFMNGPNFGRFEATVDDLPLTSPLTIKLGVNKNVYTPGGTTALTAKTTIELNPRNKD